MSPPQKSDTGAAPPSRHELGKLVAALTDLRGLSQLARCEADATAALEALRKSYAAADAPDDPQAWLLAKADSALDPARGDRVDVYGCLGRLLLACCHGELGGEAQQLLVLHFVAGLTAPQLSQALGLDGQALQARLSAARGQLAQLGSLEAPTGADRQRRLSALARTLYTAHEQARGGFDMGTEVRRALGQEAMRLCLFAIEALDAGPELRALMALCCLDTARCGKVEVMDIAQLLFEDGVREHWDRELIERGLKYLGESAQGRSMSSYHLEASIAAKHCMAADAAAVDWHGIQGQYLKLVSIRPHPTVRLRLALASARVDGAAAGLAHLEPLRDDPRLSASALLPAAIAYLCMEVGDRRQGRVQRERALSLLDDDAQRRLLTRRLRGLGR